MGEDRMGAEWGKNGGGAGRGGSSGDGTRSYPLAAIFLSLDRSGDTERSGGLCRGKEV